MNKVATRRARSNRKHSEKTQPRRPGLSDISSKSAVPRAALLLILVCAGLIATTAPAAVFASWPPIAHRARTMSATDEAHLRYVRHNGSRLFEEGTAHGTLPGNMRAECNVSVTFSASFTIYTQGGTIRGHGTATPHGSGSYQSFAGTLTVTGGTGRYAHAHGHAGLYGLFNRRTYALTVQTTGSLSY
jgi:hypothetical protein